MDIYEASFVFRPKSKAPNKYFWKIVKRADIYAPEELLACGWVKTYAEAESKCKAGLKRLGALSWM